MSFIMWTRSTLKFLFVVLAAIEVQSAPEDCPRQESLPGVLILKLGSNVVFGCRGDITVDGVSLASAGVVNKKYRNKRTEDITVRWTSQRGYANATQLTRMKRNATTGTYQKTEAKGDTTTTIKPPVTIKKEQTTSTRVLRAVTQTTGQDEKVFRITTDFEQDDYEDYDYEEEHSRVTRGIKRRTRWTLNGRQVHAGVERGGILRRPHLNWTDSGNYSCYRGERLISTFRISVAMPPERPTVYCYRRFHTSKVRCDWTSKNPVTPRTLCYLLLQKGLSGNVTRVPCSFSFSRSRCWCAFHVEEGDRNLHAAKLCVSNIAGSTTSPYLSFKLHDIIKPDPPTHVVVRAVPGQQHILKVSWSYPNTWKNDFYALLFELRYRPQLKEQYQTVPIDDVMEKQVSWTIYDAMPHTQYEVQLRAKDEFDGIWSDWTDTVYAVTWEAPKTTTTTESITLETLEMFPEGSGGSGEDSSVGSVATDGANDIDYATVWLWVSCFFGLLFLAVLTMFTVYLIRGRLHFVSRIGKQTLPFAFFLHSPRPLPAPAPSELLPEEGKSLMSPPKHNQQHFLPVQQEEQEGIHLHNMDYFLSPGTEGVPWAIDRHE
ncbi:interleukin-6 receptor subunit alpha [Labeo rohita]|uniref:interleukin-6 receptor subunit alpha n=1 Tax=Labeo rohita TaxID=84645 RepID=UPI0021E29A8C|nr:interleukin-6 receptor subunit alpha [Labeo rohita]